MHLEKQLDELLYLKIREGISFYYFGKGCIADWKENNICYLDNKDIQIIHLCNGTYILREVRNIMINNGLSSDEIMERIIRLVNKSVIRLCNFSKYQEIKLYGEWGKYYPKQVNIEITNICNFYCPFCYKSAESNGIFIDNNIILKLNNLIKGNVRNIMLTGGEPTLHPYFLEFIELFSEYANVSMISNGSELYKYDNCETLKKLSVIQFSLYGYDNKTYLKLTGVKDGFTRLQKSIELVREKGISFILSVTLSWNTMDDIENFVQAAINLNSKIIKIAVADPFGRELDMYKLNDNYYDKKIQTIQKIMELKKKYQKKILISMNNIEINMGKDVSLQKIQEKCLKCGSGIHEIVVSQEGRIRPCTYLPETIFDFGNLVALKEIINGNKKTEILCENIKNYYDYNNFIKYNIIPCESIQEFYSNFIKNK